MDTHLWSFPLHETWRRFPEVERAAAGWELWVLKQLLVPDAFLLQLAVVLVLVRHGGGEHGEDSQLETDDRDKCLAAGSVLASRTVSICNALLLLTTAR